MPLAAVRGDDASWKLCHGWVSWGTGRPPAEEMDNGHQTSEFFGIPDNYDASLGLRGQSRSALSARSALRPSCVGIERRARQNR